MLKIQAFYRTQEDLEKADELYKAVTFIINKMRLKGPNGKKELSQGFKDTKAVSCIRDIAESLAKSQVTFVSRMKTLWSLLLHPNNQFIDSFDNYCVPYEYYQGTIFGGVYYVLAKQKSVDAEHLELLETFVSGYAEALPYFNVFKTALIDDTQPLVTRPLANAASKDTDIVFLRKQFIRKINTNPDILDKLDWADVTEAFDRDVMTEIIMGINDNTILIRVVNCIVNTWNELRKLEDERCKLKHAKGLIDVSMVDPWKFGSLTKDSIDKFLSELCAKRMAMNAYSSILDNTNQTMNIKKEPKDEHASKIDMREELTKVIAEKEVMSTNIESLKNDLLAFQTRDKKGKEVPLLTAKQVAIFLKAILLEHNSLTNNVKNLAPLVQRFGGGWAATTAENALGYGVTQNECNELADIFTDYAPKIGNIIRAYPDKFKQVKGEKLQNNLKS